jgi:hypothetical protein
MKYLNAAWMELSGCAIKSFVPTPTTNLRTFAAMEIAWFGLLVPLIAWVNVGNHLI